VFHASLPPLLFFVISIAASRFSADECRFCRHPDVPQNTVIADYSSEAFDFAAVSVL